jgi:hypothetical protein
MKAVLKEQVIADSDDIVEQGCYHYFPSRVTSMSHTPTASASGTRQRERKI